MEIPSVQPAAEANPKTASSFATLHWALILVSLSFGILNFVLPVYGKEVGASAVEIGMLFSSFSLMSIVLRPLVGLGLDRYGRRWFLTGGLAVSGLAMVSFAYSTSIWGLVTARTLQGVASALLTLAASAIVADLARVDQRGKSFGAISQSMNQGAIAGTFIGFTVLFSQGIQVGWPALFLFYAAGCGLSALIAWRRMPETRFAVQTKDQTSLITGLRAVLHSRSLLVLMIVGMITGASSAMISPVLMIFLQEKFQADIGTLAWAFLPSAIVWATLPTRLGKLADRFGRKPLMVLAMFAAAVDMLLIPSLGSLVALAVLWVIEAVCFAASDPAGQALVTDLTDKDQRGRVFGIYAFSSSLGAVIGPLAGGWLYDSFSQAAPFYVNGMVLAICAGVLWFLLKEK